MVAVVLDRSLGSGRWRAALDGLGDDGLLDPDGWPEPRFRKSPMPYEREGSRPRPGRSPPSSASLAGSVEHRDAGVVPDDDVDTGVRPAPPSWLREELAAIKGIGPATADAIVLFALKRPGYPVDRASFRVLVRHGWLDATATYDEARDFVVERAENALGEARASRGVRTGGLSHGMEQLGRQFCRAAAAHCDGCPLEHLLPEGGPAKSMPKPAKKPRRSKPARQADYQLVGPMPARMYEVILPKKLGYFGKVQEVLEDLFDEQAIRSVPFIQQAIEQRRGQSADFDERAWIKTLCQASGGLLDL